MTEISGCRGRGLTGQAARTDPSFTGSSPLTNRVVVPNNGIGTKNLMPSIRSQNICQPKPNAHFTTRPEVSRQTMTGGRTI